MPIFNAEEYIKEYLLKALKAGISDDYINYIVEEILNDVIEDINECADVGFSNDDIRLAVGRVLMTKLKIKI